MRSKVCINEYSKNKKEIYFTSLVLKFRKYLMSLVVLLLECLIISSNSLTVKSIGLKY